MAEIEHVDIETLLADQPPRANFNVFFVDGQMALRMAKVEGTFPRHVHPGHDEAWFVYRGAMRIETDAGGTDLRAGQAARIPSGTPHRTVAVEPNSLVLVLNAMEFETQYLDGDTDQSVGYVEFDLVEKPQTTNGA